MVSFAFKNHYERLGVSPEASDEEIRRAYRKMALTYHPDVAKDKLWAQDIFILISEAHQVLTDAQARSRYDADLGRKQGFFGRGGDPDSDGKTTAPADEERSSVRSAVWEFAKNNPNTQRASAFNWKNTANTTRPRMRKRPDLDARANIEIPLEDALQGALHTVTIECTDPGEKSHRLSTYHVRIPANVWQGQELRLGSCGLTDPVTGEKGDLYLKIHYARHKRFRLMGDNLLVEIEVPVWDVVLGGFMRIPGLESEASLQIPPGAQMGQRFTLKDQGMPTKAGGRGDLIVSLKINLPQAQTQRQKDAWRNLMREYGR